MQHFMLKELIYRASMAYNDEDFKEVVDDYVAGKWMDRKAPDRCY